MLRRPRNLALAAVIGALAIAAPAQADAATGPVTQAQQAWQEGAAAALYGFQAGANAALYGFQAGATALHDAWMQSLGALTP